MRLYLSSYKFGNQPEKLLGLLHGQRPKVAIVTNAGDFGTEERLLENYEEQATFFKGHGFEVERLDLKQYFGKSKELAEQTKQCGLFWVRGGNVFVLLKAMRYSGFDEIITERLIQDTAVYGGYSAGVCVLSPTLAGIELCDDKNATPEGYDKEIIWDGLNILPYSIAPHYKSDHPESVMIDDVVAYFEHNKLPYKTLIDGQAILIDGDKEEMLK